MIQLHVWYLISLSIAFCIFCSQYINQDPHILSFRTQSFLVDSTDFSTMSTGSIWQRQEALTHTSAPEREAAPLHPCLGRWSSGLGCVGCGRFRRGTSAPCGDPPRFSSWDAAQVATWVASLGLKDAAQRLLTAGMDGELLLEWLRMRCVAPEAFYQLTRQDLQLSLVDLLRLTRGLTRICEDARAPLIE